LWFSHGNGQVSVWSATDKSLLCTIQIGNERIYAMMHCGSEMWLAGDNPKIQLWDSERYKFSETLPQVHQHTIRSMVKIQNTIFSGSADGILAEWDIEIKSLRRKLEFKDTICALCIINFEYLAIGFNNGKLMLLELQELNSVWEGSCHQKQINAIVNTEKDLWTASDDATIAVWTINKREGVVEVVLTIRNTCGVEKILSLCTAFDSIILSGSYSEILVWDATSKRCIQEVKNAHKDQIPVLISVGQLSVWSGSNSLDGSICAWAKNQHCISGSDLIEGKMVPPTRKIAPTKSFTNLRTDSKLSHPTIKILQTA